MKSTKVYHMVTITVSNVKEFNTFWERESLPHWLRYARHLGSFTYLMGGRSNQILRLFEYESLAKWAEWQHWLRHEPEGQALMAKLGGHGIVAEPALLVDAPTL